MGYTILLKPYFLICFGSGLGMGVLALLLGSAPFVAPLLLGLNSSFYLGLGLLGTVVVLSLFSKLREHIDWKEIFRLGPFFFVGAGAAFYYSFQFYFRYSGLFLFVSAVAWLFSVPFLPRHTTNRQFLFFPFLSNVLQGFLGGLVVGGLGLAGLPLVTPFLQIFRKMDRSAATSTSVPLSALSLIPMVLVLSLHPASQTPLQPNNQMFLLVGLLFVMGLIFGLNFGKKLLKSLSPLVISLVQITTIVLMIFGGFRLVESSLPCFSQNPLTCISCFRRQSQELGWKSFDWLTALNEQHPSMDIVIDSCGYPMGFHRPSNRRSDLIVELPDHSLWMGIDKLTGRYTQTWDGLRTKRVKKQRVYFTKDNCKGEAAISKRKLETQVGSTIFNDSGYRDVKGLRSAFWYISYRDPEGECVSQSGMIKASSDLGVYDLSASTLKTEWGEPILDEDCCHKFSQPDHFESIIYFSDEDCQSSQIATDDEGAGKIGQSILHHQDKYYLTKNLKSFFEYKSYRVSGKDCVKQEGILSPLSERLAFSVEELDRPVDFSQHPPLSVRTFHSGDFDLWLGKP